MYAAFLLQVHPTGKTFSVIDGEGKTATVDLNEPVSESNHWSFLLKRKMRHDT